MNIVCHIDHPKFQVVNKYDWDFVGQGLQGGPHNHTISGLAVALKMANTPEFKQYQIEVIANCRAMSARFTELGYKVFGCFPIQDVTELDTKLLVVNPMSILLSARG